MMSSKAILTHFDILLENQFKKAAGSPAVFFFGYN
jgi:hypothetical protein